MRAILLVLALASLHGTVPAVEAQGRPLPEYRDRLPNGLRTVVVPLPGAARTCLALVVTAGRSFEPVGEEGVARVAAELARAAGVDGSSATIRSRVGRLNVTFRACGARGEAAALAGSLALLTGPSTGAESAVPAEVPTTEDLALDLLYGSLFPDHPLGRSVVPALAGEPSRDAALAFRRSRYTPLGSSLVVVGDLEDPFLIAREVGRPFLSWPVRAAAGLEAPPGAGNLSEEVLRGSGSREGGDSGSSVILVGGRLGREDFPERYAAALLLIEVARARLSKGQVSLSPLDGPALLEGGVWVLGVRAREGETEAALDLVSAALEGLATAEMEEGELEAARARVLSGRLSPGRGQGSAAPDPNRVIDLLLESSPGVGDTPSAPGMIELSAGLLAVGPEELQAEAARIFTVGRRVVVAVGSGGP